MSRKLRNLILMALLSEISTGYAWADQVVRIGEAGPLTGGIAHLGKDNENGARLAIEEFNATGLVINGEKIKLELDSQDDANDPRTATQVAQRLVDDKVVAVVGHLSSGASIPASKIYADAGVPEISPSATNPVYTKQGFGTTFRLVATDASQGPALAFAAKQGKIKTVAIIDDSSAYGQGLADEFEKSAKAGGIAVLSRDATNDKAIDFRAILTKIKGENPDAIMFGGVDSTGGPLIRQAKQLGLRAKILSGDGICSEKLPDLAGEAVDGVTCSEAGASLSKMEGGNAFAEKYQKRFGQPVQIYAPAAYDAVYVIVDAMKKANSIDPKKINAAMRKTKYKGVTGEISFDQYGDLQHGVISLYTYRQGKKTFATEVKL